MNHRKCSSEPRLIVTTFVLAGALVLTLGNPIIHDANVAARSSEVGSVEVEFDKPDAVNVGEPASPASVEIISATLRCSSPVATPPTEVRRRSSARRSAVARQSRFRPRRTSTTPTRRLIARSGPKRSRSASARASIDSSRNLISGAVRDTADDVIARLQDAASKVHTLRADIKTSSKNRQLGGTPETSSATVYFKMDPDADDSHRALIKYVGPPAKDVRVNGETVEIYEPAIKQVTRRSASSAQDSVDGYMHLASVSDMEYVGDETVGNKRAAVIKMTPRNPDKILSARVWIARTDWLPRKFEVVYATTTLTITVLRISVNVALSDSIFKASYPRGTTVVNL